VAEIEIAGIKFQGGMMAVAFTALTTLGGAAWGAFEFYKDYTDMKEIVQNIDVGDIQARNDVIEVKLDEAIDYSRSIKNDLRDDFNRMERRVDRFSTTVRSMEEKVDDQVDRANEKFDMKRESLQNDTRLMVEQLEDRLNKKIQSVLDNPLAD
jgi:dsDNA-specific endonuclease/ATPase MutS2